MPSVTFCLPWPTLSVAPLPPRLVLTPVLLRLILTPGSTLNVLRKRKYPIGLMPLVDWSRCVLGAPGLSGLFDLDSPLFATYRTDASNPRSAVQVEQVSEPSD